MFECIEYSVERIDGDIIVSNACSWRVWLRLDNLCDSFF